jgi:O-succinylbenzoic acid--CoA ligase
MRWPKQVQNERLENLGCKIRIEEETLIRFLKPKKFLPSSFVLFTSGTTDRPKAARLRLEALLANAQEVNRCTNFQAEDRWTLSLPLFHVGGLGILLRATIASGTLCLSPHERSATHLSQVPTQLYRAWPISPRLKAVLLGGAPITETPERLPIIATYGLTEMGSAVLARRNPVWHSGHCFLGFPLPGREIELRAGEIWVRGQCRFDGYGTDNVFDKNGWFATGDLAICHPEWGYAIVGRKDNLFISGGENVQPEEIERELKTHPAVVEAMVIPRRDPEYGARPVAFIQSIRPIPQQEWHRRLEQTLPKFKIPLSFLPWPEEIEAGKGGRKKLFDILNANTKALDTIFLVPTTSLAVRSDQICPKK